MRRAAKKDGNHNDIADHLRAHGWSWEDTHALGDGFPDGIAGRPGWCCLVEIKDGNKPPSARKLTTDEQKFAERWTGPLIVALSPEDAQTKLWAEYRRFWGT